MRKLLIWLYWLDFFVMMLVPLVLVVSARLRFYPLLDNVSYLALLWLITATIFLGFAAFLVSKLQKTVGNIISDTQLKSNLRQILLIVTLSLPAAAFVFIKRKIPLDSLWDILIVYWAVFTLSIFRIMQQFISHCHDEKILR